MVPWLALPNGGVIERELKASHTPSEYVSRGSVASFEAAPTASHAGRASRWPCRDLCRTCCSAIGTGRYAKVMQRSARFDSIPPAQTPAVNADSLRRLVWARPAAILDANLTEEPTSSF